MAMTKLGVRVPRLEFALTLGLVLAAALSQGGCAPDDVPVPAGEADPLERISGALTTVATTSSEYKLPAHIDPDVLDNRVIELWARVYRPATLVSGRRYPVVLFLHGNHATCGHGSNPRIDDSIEYTDSGTCPTGYVVVPSHEGYAYVANQLASQEYIVVSINANRGINGASGDEDDFGLNLARGRLVLRHLDTLSQWDRGVTPTPSTVGASLAGHLDLNQVGLMGHSRGGEGMRAAYNQYLDAGSPWPARIVTPVRFRGIFEVGPVDGQSSRVLDMASTRWAVLLPMCDGDVSDLQGIRPFDRSMSFTSETFPEFKSSLTAWGTNHNYFNSQWQQSDSSGCMGHTPLFSDGPGITGSSSQREVGRIAMSSFFLANVGNSRDPSLNAMFDPSNALPAALASITRVDRGFTLSPDSDITLRLEDFGSATGTSTFGQPNQASNITVMHNGLPDHDFFYQGAVISWSSAGTNRFFQTNFTPTGSGISLSAYGTLDMRVDRAQFDPLNDGIASTDFTVQLVNAQNVLSAPQQIATYLSLVGPVGGPFTEHTMLQTARIPLSSFGAGALASVRGVRLTFNKTARGSIYIGNIRATRATTCPTTPKLDLKVRQVLRSANEIQFRAQVFNRTTTSIKLSDLSVKAWISDPSSNVVAQVFYGGNVFNGTGTYQFGPVATSAGSTRIQPACTSEPTRVADWTATVAGTDTRSLPANGGAWVDTQLSVHRADWAPFASLNDDFSRTPAYQGTTISDLKWPTVYGDDTHFVLYYQGNPVSEFVSSTTADPAGGNEPSCLRSCPRAITSASASSATASPADAPAAGISGTAATPMAAGAAIPPTGRSAALVPSFVMTPGRILQLRPTNRVKVPGGVDVEVSGDTPFPVGALTPMLVVGGAEVAISRYPDPSDLHRLVFTMTAQQFASLVGGESAIVRYSRQPGRGPEWQLGAFDKGLLVP